MKFFCECGFLFKDQTDDLPFKGYVCPDQSQEEIYNAITELLVANTSVDLSEKDEKIHPIIHPKGSKTIYQCPDCGNIFIEDGENIFMFEKVDRDCPNNLLSVRK